MSALFVVDPLDGLDAGIDSNVGLMAATSDADRPVWVCGPEDLALVAGRLLARARRIVVRPRVPRGDHRWLVASPWFDELEHRVLDVADEVAVALLRLDPPVDPRYLRTTYLLDVAHDAGVHVVNRPGGVRELQEKLWALQFPDLGPETCVTAEVDRRARVRRGPCDRGAQAGRRLLRHRRLAAPHGRPERPVAGGVRDGARRGT